MKTFLNIGIIAVLIAIVAFGFTATYATGPENYIDTKAPTVKKREPVSAKSKNDVAQDEEFSEEANYDGELEENETTEGDATTSDGAEDIETLTYNLVHEKLTTPLREKVKKGGSKKSFSRCPSGYQPYVDKVATAETEYSYGIMEFYEGCDGTTVCNFRTRLSDQSVDILQGDSVNYITVDLWLNKATSSIK